MNRTILVFVFGIAQAAFGGEIYSQAQTRIEQIRRSEVEIRFLDVENKPLPAGTEVVIEQTRHAFLFGCNIFMLDRCRGEKDNQLYRQQFSELFNFATLGFYWAAYEPQNGQTESKRWKAVAQWCKDNHIVTKGHPLFWTIEPGWVGRLPEDKGQELLFGRIEREIRDFAGLVDIWDVLNEPAVGIEQGTERKAAAAVRAYQNTGTTGTIARAFKTARDASTDAVLILNDYDVSQKYETIIEDCLKQGVGIDVIGIQSHQHGGAWSDEKIWEVCQRFGRFGKPLHFTETTFVSGKGKWEDWQKTDAQAEQRQARQVERFYTILFSHPAVEAITWWDFSDQGAWQKAPAGLLREDMSAKPAYETLHRLIRETWRTKAAAAVDSEGKVRLKGYYGDYRVSAKIQGVGKTGSFVLGKGDKHKQVELK